MRLDLSGSINLWPPSPATMRLPLSPQALYGAMHQKKNLRLQILCYRTHLGSNTPHVLQVVPEEDC